MATKRFGPSGSEMKKKIILEHIRETMNKTKHDVLFEGIE